MNLTVLHAHYVPAVLTTFSLFLNHIIYSMEEYSFWNIILPDLPMVGLVSMSSLQNGPPEHPTLSSHLVSRPCPCVTHCFCRHRTGHYLKFSSLFICLLSRSPLPQCEFQESGNCLFLLNHTVFTEPASVSGAEKVLR